MFSEQEKKYLTKAKKLKYWSKIQNEDACLASFLSHCRLVEHIGLLNDHHIEIIGLQDEIVEPKVMTEIKGLYRFDFLIQRIKNKILEYDQQRIMAVSHEDDPEWDISGRLEFTDHILDLTNVEKIKNVLGLYTGETEATFQSGRGFTHRQLKDDVIELIRDFIYDPHNVTDHKKILALANVDAAAIDEDNWEQVVEFLCDELTEVSILADLAELNLNAKRNRLK